MTYLRETDGRLKLSRISSVMAGVGSVAGRVQGGLNTPSLRELNALLHIRQLAGEMDGCRYGRSRWKGVRLA